MISFAIVLYLDLLQKIQKISMKQPLHIELVITHTILELDVFGIPRKFLVTSKLSLKFFYKKIKNSLLRIAKSPNDHILVARTLKG